MFPDRHWGFLPASEQGRRPTERPGRRWRRSSPVRRTVLVDASRCQLGATPKPRMCMNSWLTAVKKSYLSWASPSVVEPKCQLTLGSTVNEPPHGPKSVGEAPIAPDCPRLTTSCPHAAEPFHDRPPGPATATELPGKSRAPTKITSSLAAMFPIDRLMVAPVDGSEKNASQRLFPPGVIAANESLKRLKIISAAVWRIARFSGVLKNWAVSRL